MTLDPRALRSAFGSFMTGVTVVTTRNAHGQPVGFTANSFTSVSLDPPLLLVCPGRFLSTHDTFAQCRHFAVNVLAEGQEDVSNTFASYKGDRFARVAHRIDALGNPLIDGALAQFSCTTERAMDAGDHSLLIGRVAAFHHAPGRGLGYAGGKYFSLGLERAALEQSGRGTICGAIIEHGGKVLLEQTPDGFRPPQITLPDRGRLRHDLAEALAARGLPVQVKSAYSIFDIGDMRFTYLLATTEAATTGPLTAIAPEDLPALSYTSPPIADMMTRFALEARTRSFGLYLGDGRRGDVHSPLERT
ncbi:flavin reductase family protein [Marinovum sp.]|uniref:flavin reductase family protein n=1 Tax=Marinovum sp. TaxID=2024839 RepID=UPI003A8F5BE7